MAQQRASQSSYQEADIILAISAIQNNPRLSVRCAASLYNVPRTTLRTRRAQKPARRDCTPNLKKLTQLEEEAIITYILELDLRGFAPNLYTVREMANSLLAERGVQPVGKQ